MLKHFFRFVSLCLCVAMLLSFGLVANGANTETAIAISSKEDFNNIRNNLSGDYYLTCDIEFSASDFASGGAYYNSGKFFVPIGSGKTPFTGTFDGKGYTISGIKVSVSGSVYNMSVTPVNTGISTLADDDWTGDYIINPNPKLNVSPAVGVFGSNKGTIKNVNISGCSITARSSNSATLYVGGVAGHNNGNILNCSVNNTLNCDRYSYIGGITGYQSGGNIKNCYVLGKIESEGVFGSVAGAIAGGNVSECYADVTFTSTAAADFGLVGIDVQNNINNCYYISNTELDGFGNLISTINAKNPKAYINFDFNENWYMSGATRRPALKVSKNKDITTGDLNNDKTVDLTDIVVLAQYVANWDVLAHTEVANVDFNFNAEGDGIIDLQDVVYLAQSVAKWDSAVLY